MRAAVLVLVASLVALFCAAPLGSSAPSTLSQPVLVAAFANPGGAVVAWAPGAVQPDAYIVYGDVGDQLYEIETVPADQVMVSVSEYYPAYAVAAVQDGVASEATVGVTLVEDCFTIEWTPPPPSVGIDQCVPSQTLPVGGKVWVSLPL
jgi:hypothetical protein